MISSNPSLLVLNNVLNYAEPFLWTLREWRNLPEVTRYFVLETITESMHQQWLDKLKNSPDACGAYVAEVETQPVGLGYWFRDQSEPTRLHIGLYLVKAEQRGKGLGRQLLTALLQNCFHHHGADVIELEVLSNNLRAIRLYEQLGFVILPDKKRAIEKQGERVEVVSMALRRTETDAQPQP